jgi:hypothetical protein
MTHSNARRPIYNYYNEKGDRILEETDDGADGTIDFRVTITYDESGKVVTTEYDGSPYETPDGTADYRYTETHDEDGNVILEETDQDADGMIDGRRTYTYDERGNMLSRGPASDDNDGEGLREFFTYDDEDRMLSHGYDLGMDGTVDVVETYSYHCTY